MKDTCCKKMGKNIKPGCCNGRSELNPHHIEVRHRIHIIFQHSERNIAYRNVLCSVWYICCCLFMFNFVLVLWEADEATIWIDISTQGCQRPVDKCLPCHKICPSIDPWPCVPLHFFHRLLAKWMINLDRFRWDHLDFILLGLWHTSIKYDTSGVNTTNQPTTTPIGIVTGRNTNN